MPHLPERGNHGACPDAATILAVIEGEADEWLRNAYAQHLAQCSACLDLDSRLRNFDRPVLADEAEWRQIEKRLDNRMNASLDSRPTALSLELPEPEARPVGFWHSIWRPGLAWKISLATALVALVAVGVDVYLRLQPPVASSTVNARPNGAPKSTEPETPPTATPLLGGGIPQSGPMAAAPKAPSQIVAQPKQEETAAATNRAVPSEPQAQATLEPPPTTSVHGPEPRATAPGQATAARTTVKAQPSGTEAAVIAENSTPIVTPPVATTRTGTATAMRPANASAKPSSAATGPAMENVAAGRASGYTTNEQAPPAAANSPASLHLAAGARLWLALDSFRFQGDGRVIFYGSLLLPLNSKGSSALEHGTEVSGFITSAQGQSSVLLSEIVIRGSHYKLMSQAGAGNARTAGSGGAVQFDSGKVLEMWVSSDSIYERATTDSQ